MLYLFRISLASFIILLILGCDKPGKTTTLPASAFMSAEWVDLIPKDDLNALLNPPEYIENIVDGSAEDKLNKPFNNTPTNNAQNSNEDRYQQALASTRIIPEINNVPVRMPAFIVPLAFDDAQRVTKFFMVPYYGACLHEPPPPPNQTIYVDYPQGFKIDAITEPYWISGILKTSLIENDIATAAYSMEMHAFELYTD